MEPNCSKGECYILPKAILKATDKETTFSSDTTPFPRVGKIGDPPKIGDRAQGEAGFVSQHSPLTQWALKKLTIITTSTAWLGTHKPYVHSA